ncbi:MAG: GNAT family N-acetyltransferase [Syntrophomonadaceae bacterium]|nr:GNAT family N-acetyltransferase [Syntrophomonadaceae bacterium]
MVELVNSVVPAEVERMVALEEEAFGPGGLNAWTLVPLIRHGRVFALRSGDDIVGLVQYMRDWENPRTAYLVGVSVAARLRGNGLGTRLLRQSLQRLAAEGITRVELTVSPANVAAIHVYEEHLGFTAVAYREHEYGRGENRLVLALELSNAVEYR